MISAFGRHVDVELTYTVLRTQEASNVPYARKKEEKKKRCALQESAKVYLVSLFKYTFQSQAILPTKLHYDLTNPFLSYITSSNQQTEINFFGASSARDPSRLQPFNSLRAVDRGREGGAGEE